LLDSLRRPFARLDLRRRVFLAAVLSLLLASGCELDCGWSFHLFPCWTGLECPDGSCAQCCHDSDCENGFPCLDGSCVDPCPARRCGCCLGDPGCECCDDQDCPGEQICEKDAGEGAGHACFPPCRQDGQGCGEDTLPCCEGLTCYEAEAICMPTCEADEDCWIGPDPFTEDRACEDGICLFVACGQDSDCLERQSCFEGLCLSPVPCDRLAYCAVEPWHLALDPGGQALLSAAAFTRDNEPLPVAGFTWSSDDPGLVAVDADGLVIAGPDPGETLVTAQVDGCLFVCSARVFVAEP